MTDARGIDRSYIDANGEEQHVPQATVEALAAIIGGPTDHVVPLVARAGESPPVGRGEVHLEDGGTRPVDGALPGELPLGYHTLVGADGAERPLIVSPGRCHLPAGWRAWGWATQLYATRSSASWGMGDLGDLARLARWSRSQGAGFVLVNPLGAVAPVGAQQPSPYYPSSRRYRNPLYLRVEDVPGARDADGVLEQAAAAGRALNDDRAIDRDAAWALKERALRATWAARRGDDGFDAWYRSAPDGIGQFATWTALAERHGAGWQDWPADCRHPDGPGLAAAAGELDEEVRFHAWLQWLLEEQLAAAGRELSVVQDLPIGVDPGGFDAWAWQDLLALDVSVGAPGDEFNRQGQDWGLPPFVPWRLRAAGYQPFIDTIRASMAAGGGLRVDHVMGLFRLWWIARGTGAAAGAYVRYPADDLLAIVALESQRAGAVVVGEDLGTVEESARHALAAHDVLSYRLLWFEEDPPEAWPAKAMAAVTTHDLPTVAGLWDGSDLESQIRLGLDPNEEGTHAMRARVAAAAGLPADAGVDDAVVGAHRLLARSPATMLVATLDDAVAEPERPNIPGADGARPNWAIALPLPLEALEEAPLAGAIGRALDGAVRDGVAVATDPTSEGSRPSGGS